MVHLRLEPGGSLLDKLHFEFDVKAVVNWIVHPRLNGGFSVSLRYTDADFCGMGRGGSFCGAYVARTRMLRHTSGWTTRTTATSCYVGGTRKTKAKSKATR